MDLSSLRNIFDLLKNFKTLGSLDKNFCTLLMLTEQQRFRFILFLHLERTF